MSKIFYFCFVSNLNNNRKCFLAGESKSEYIIKSLESMKCNVDVFSFAENISKNRFIDVNNGVTFQKNNINYHFFRSCSSKIKIIRPFLRFFDWTKRKKIINRKLKENSDFKIIIYHSLAFKNLYKMLKVKKVPYTLELEEIYSDVNEKENKQNEIKLVNLANSYILSTSLLRDTIIDKTKPYVISNGSYRVFPNVNHKITSISMNPKKIHIVYAGTFDSRKGGAIAAATAAAFLPNRYHLHIIGFGSDKEVNKIQTIVNNIKRKSEADISYDGMLVGDEYIGFLQKCQIGLSTQSPTTEFNDTSFPSKILSYLGNGLHVVSIKISAVETSEVSKFITFYDEQTPQQIAKAIMSVDLNEKFDSRTYILNLHTNFVNSLKDLLNL